MGNHHVRRHVDSVNTFITPTTSSRQVVSIGLDFTCRVFGLVTIKVRWVSVDGVCRGDKQTTTAQRLKTLKLKH